MTRCPVQPNACLPAPGGGSVPERGSERRSPRLPAFCCSQPGLQPSLPPQHTSLGTGLQIHSNPATHTHTQRAPATCHRRQDTSNPHSDRLSPCVNSCTISTASLVTTLTESEWILSEDLCQPVSGTSWKTNVFKEVSLCDFCMGEKSEPVL